MKTKNDLAELLFDCFRKARCRSGRILMKKTATFTIIDKLNPKEQDLFNETVNDLISNEYIIYQDDSPKCFKLTDKGYDFVYDKNAILQLHKTNNMNIINWEQAFNRLWKIIGDQEKAEYYIKGSDYLNIAREFDDSIPSYTRYLEKIKRPNGMTRSRQDYYLDIILSMPNDKCRHDFFVHLMSLLEPHNPPSLNKLKELFVSQVANSESVILVDVKNQVEQQEIAPKVLVSYSWDDKAHKNWVLELADKLSNNGVHVFLDQYDLNAGKDLTHFMESAVQQSDKVLLIMTPNYKIKAENRKGGVGYECSMITAEIFNNQTTDKFIPIRRVGEREQCTPIFVKSRLDIDMGNDDLFESSFEELLRVIYNEPRVKRPQIGEKPIFS